MTSTDPETCGNTSLQRTKLAHPEQDRIIYSGPQGQDIMRQFLVRVDDACCISPQESIDRHRAERHAQRATPLSCGYGPGSNRQRRLKRTPRDRYEVASYRRAIRRACNLAFPAPADVGAFPGALAA